MRAFVADAARVGDRSIVMELITRPLEHYLRCMYVRRLEGVCSTWR